MPYNKTKRTYTRKPRYNRYKKGMFNRFQKNYIHKVVKGNIEKKVLIVSGQDNIITDTSAKYNLCYIPEGTSLDERIGKEIQPLFMKIKGLCRWSSTPNYSVTFKLVVYVSLDGEPASLDIPYYPVSYIGDIAFKRFWILKEVTLNIEKGGSGVIDFNINLRNLPKHLRKCLFQSSNANDCMENCIKVEAVCSDDNAYSYMHFDYNYTMWYIDA